MYSGVRWGLEWVEAGAVCVEVTLWNAGLQSRVETQEADEDEEGMSEPAEVADFLNELGESDKRWTCYHNLINSHFMLSSS